jgi:MYXO-CTERM domain-containing protein
MIRKQLKTALSAIALGLAASTAAQAGVIDFEDVTPTLFAGSSVTSGGADFASAGTGFSGVDSALGFSIFGNAPNSSTGQFLFALNNDSITVTLGGLGLTGFDAAFIAPVQVGAGLSAGLLHIAAQTDAGLIEEDYDFGESDATGVWSFLSFNSSGLAGLAVSSVTFSACVYDGLGGCVVDPLFLPQFAIDNLRVPEPASAALALAALGLLAATRRRQSV